MSKSKQTLIYAHDNEYYQVISENHKCKGCSFYSSTKKGIAWKDKTCPITKCYGISCLLLESILERAIKFRRIYHIPTDSRIIYNIK